MREWCWGLHGAIGTQVMEQPLSMLTGDPDYYLTPVLHRNKNHEFSRFLCSELLLRADLKVEKKVKTDIAYPC